MAAQPGFVSYLVRNQEDKFSHDTAQVSLSLTLISTTVPSFTKLFYKMSYLMTKIRHKQCFITVLSLTL